MTMVGESSDAIDPEGLNSDNDAGEIDQPGIVNPLMPPDPLIIENFDDHLPPTVTLLKSANNAKVYLVGTAHFSKESQDDVSTVIRNVRPHYVMVELCKDREIMLKWDEETLKRHYRRVTFADIMIVIKNNGLVKGLLIILRKKKTAQIVEQLGMPPGLEVRRAFAEVKMLKNCTFRLGDRPSDVTSKRAWSAISWWNCIRFISRLPFSIAVKKEDVEKMKKEKYMERYLKEISRLAPELFRVLVEERDIYLTHSLQLGVDHKHGEAEPTRVVGIVGTAHVPGIRKLWGTVRHSDIPPLMKIPPPSKLSRIINVTLAAATVVLLLWGAYKLCPKILLEAISNVPRRISSLCSQVDYEAYLASIKAGLNFDISDFFN